MLKQLNIQQLLNLSEEEFLLYKAILENQKPTKNLGFHKAPNFMKLPYSKVGNIRLALSNPSKLYELFEMVYGVSKEQFFVQSCQDLFSCLNWINAEIEIISKIENQAFQDNQDSAVWEMAGGSKLSVFAHWNNQIMLAKEFSLTPQEVGEMPYEEVLTILAQRETHLDVMQKFNELKAKPNV